MTAQRKNIFKFDGISYSVVSTSNPIGIKPADFGIIPQYIETGCYRGYWYEYGIQNQQLVIENMFINSSKNKYPKVAGKRPVRFLRKDGYHKYESLNINLNYSGEILLGKDYLRKYAFDICKSEPWEYEILIKLKFKNGILVDVMNCNEIAQCTRQFLTDNPDERHMFFGYEFLEKLYDSG